MMKQNNSVHFEYPVFELNDTFIDENKQQFLIISIPKRKWYLLILQYLSFNYYKAPWVYNIKPINKYEK